MDPRLNSLESYMNNTRLMCKSWDYTSLIPNPGVLTALAGREGRTPTNFTVYHTARKHWVVSNHPNCLGRVMTAGLGRQVCLIRYELSPLWRLYEYL